MMKRRSMLQILLLSWIPIETVGAEDEPSTLETVYSEGDLSIALITQTGSSMFPTIADGDLCVVELFNADTSSFQRGEIVIFDPPVASSNLYLKRIVGLPGEKVEIHEGSVVIDGNDLLEPYVESGTTECTRECTPWFVGEDEMFVLGDNRFNSSDSRVFGPIQTKTIHGKVTFVGHMASEPVDGAFGTTYLEPTVSGDTRILALTAKGNFMSPTIRSEATVLLDPHAFADRMPFRGEIVAFQLSPDASDAFIRRVVGLPNEVVEFKAGNLIIDGFVLDEPYIESYFTDCRENPCEPSTIPNDSFFVLSDNRDAGEDSRTFGTVSLDMMLGSVIFHF